MFIKNKTQFIIIVFLIFFHLNCSKEKTSKIINGVYYWKTSFDLNQDDFEWIKENSIQKIYTRFFDIDWEPETKQALPIANLRIVTKYIPDVEIIPTVFITNRTFINIPDSSLTDLASKIFEKIKSQSKTFNTSRIKEIQLDCDWSVQTREKYFTFIKDIGNLSRAENVSLSATIRLHQVKYFEITGVPPVDRGSLMFYNMSPVSDLDTKNSIFNEEVAKKYLVNFDKYPLKLNVILPAFSWGVLFRRNKIMGIINEVNFEELYGNSNFVELKNNLFESEKGFYFHERYLKPKDIIRVEEITPEITLLAAELIAPYIINDSVVVSLYHLNKEVIKNYDKGDIQDIISTFQ